MRNSETSMMPDLQSQMISVENSGGSTNKSVKYKHIWKKVQAVNHAWTFFDWFLFSYQNPRYSSIYIHCYTFMFRAWIEVFSSTLMTHFHRFNSRKYKSIISLTQLQNSWSWGFFSESHIWWCLHNLSFWLINILRTVSVEIEGTTFVRISSFAILCNHTYLTIVLSQLELHKRSLWYAWQLLHQTQVCDLCVAGFPSHVLCLCSNVLPIFSQWNGWVMSVYWSLKGIYPKLIAKLLLLRLPMNLPVSGFFWRFLVSVVPLGLS